MKWPEVRLDDICDIVIGATPSRSQPSFWGGSHTWVTISDLTDRAVTKSKERITDLGVASSASKLVRAGTLLFSFKLTIGRIAIAGRDLYTNEAIAALPIKPSAPVLRDYLRFALMQVESLHSVDVAAKGPLLNKAKVSALSIPLPTISEQRRIVEILEQADELRQKGTEARDLAERIIPALFVKLFGDPVTNARNWSVFSLSEFFTQDRHGPRCGPFGTALKKHEYVDRGIPVWGIDNVLPNRFLETGSLFVTEEKFQELTSYAVQVGDVLISRAGTVGRMCVARPSVSRSIIGTNLIGLAFDTGALEPEYFSAMFTYFPHISLRFRAVSDEGAYSFMNTSVLKSLQIPVPPIALQRLFATHTSKMRELVEKQQSSRCQIRSLFDTLIRRAFSGVLSAKWREAHMRELLAEMEQQSKLLGDASARDLTFV